MARAIWSGTISFGLVSVPVKMFSATESKELRFHFLHREDLTPIGYDKVRKDTGEHVDPDEIVPIHFRKAYYLVPQGTQKKQRKRSTRKKAARKAS